MSAPWWCAQPRGTAARVSVVAALVGLVVGLELVGSAVVGASAEPPAWDPHTGDLLFAANREGNSEIYLRRGGAPEWVNLTNHPARDNWPVWSPDGDRIAFQSDRSGNLDLWTMNADGSDPRQLTTDSEPDYLPAFAPDGQRLVFTSWRREAGDTERQPHLYLVQADGSGERRLVAASLGTSAGATWSPDGQQLVFNRGSDQGADLYLVRADGSGERRLTHDEERGVYRGSPTFSPDGQWIAHYADDHDVSALVVVSVDGERRRVLVAEGKNWYPRWSPDGRWLTYTAAVPGGAAGEIDLFAVAVDGGAKPVRLLGGGRRHQEGSWRPMRLGDPPPAVTVPGQP